MTMFLETVRSEGLAHHSYIFGHGGTACVIDPRRDCDIYQEIAERHGAAITHIFETHKHEDFVSGSIELARRTQAEILHGKALDFAFGAPAVEGDSFQFGSLLLRVLETPGHTDESLSLALYDTDTSPGTCIGVFTGDALFIGDVGRTDFYPDRLEEVAGLLYDSLHEKILPLGDQAILYPAHGAGSVCGSAMAERDFSTLGMERLHNSMLQMDSRQAFVQAKLDEQHASPSYFRKMEEYNRLGNAPERCGSAAPRPLDLQDFTRRVEAGMIVLDVRSPEAFAGAFIPGSLAVPLSMLSAWAGHFLDYDHDIGLVTQEPAEAEQAAVHLLRMGFDRVAGYLRGGLKSFETGGHAFDRIPAVHVSELVRRIDQNDGFLLLDVRKDAEVAQGHLPGAMHIPLSELEDRLGELDPSRPVTTFCGSGMRAIIAASLLKRNGFADVEDALGSMAACKAMGCPIENA